MPFFRSYSTIILFYSLCLAGPDQNKKTYPVDAQLSERFDHDFRSDMRALCSGLQSCRLVLSRKHSVLAAVGHYPPLSFF